MRNIAIIPARGGSKRIPRKNIKNFLGKPIISYSIIAALESGLFDEVMVSTDDEEIANVARKYLASVPFTRSVKNADDFAATADVLLEVLEEYKKIGREFEYLCCIYPAAPFIIPTKLKDSFQMLIEKKANSIIPVVKFSHPIQRAFNINSEGNLEYIWPENINKRSQDLKFSYHDAGQFYWCRVDSFLRNRSIINSNSMPFIVSEMEVQDIDNEEDWKMAVLKFQLIK